MKASKFYNTLRNDVIRNTQFTQMLALFWNMLIHIDKCNRYMYITKNGMKFDIFNTKMKKALVALLTFT